MRHKSFMDNDLCLRYIVASRCMQRKRCTSIGVQRDGGAGSFTPHGCRLKKRLFCLSFLASPTPPSSRGCLVADDTGGCRSCPSASVGCTAMDRIEMVQLAMSELGDAAND